MNNIIKQVAVYALGIATLGAVVFGVSALDARATHEAVHNNAPTVNQFQLLTTGRLRPGQSIRFIGEGCDPLDKHQVSGHMSFGDGNGKSFGLTCGHPEIREHIYSKPGTYHAAFAVRDALGAESVMNLTIYIESNGPTARLMTSPSRVEEDFVVTFDASGSNDPDRFPLIYRFNFGDGQFVDSDFPIVTHNYSNANTYHPKVTVIDSEGLESSASTRVIVVDKATDSNKPPVIRRFDSDHRFDEIFVGEDIEFNISVCDPEREQLFVKINYGDGTESDWIMGCNSIQKNHFFFDSGVFYVTLRVRDTFGREVHDVIEVRVDDDFENLAPIADFIWNPLNPKEDERVQFTNASTDPDGRTGIDHFRWRFGDGTRTTTSQNPSHVFREPGTYVVTLDVEDSKGLESTVSKTIRIRDKNSNAVLLNNSVASSNNSSNVTVAPNTNRGQLVRVAGDPKVYYINAKGQKRHIINEAVFNSYGNRWSDVQVISRTELSKYPTSNLVRVAGGTRVYVIEGETKRWVTSGAAFNRRGYDWNAIVTINQTEFNAYRTGSNIN